LCGWEFEPWLMLNRSFLHFIIFTTLVEDLETLAIFREELEVEVGQLLSRNQPDEWPLTF